MDYRHKPRVGVGQFWTPMVGQFSTPIDNRPATPCQRLLSDARISVEMRQRLQKLQATLDPVSLLHEMRVAQQHLVEIADTPTKSDIGTASQPTLEAFLSGLRIAWQDGEVRPTAKPKVKVKHLRRRPDPLAAVASDIRTWFEAEPWRTGRELLEQLQQAHPGVYPDGQLRTLQRRLKVWRGELARKMVFGTVDRTDAEDPNPGVSARP
jgi:hypothetical protein